MGNKFVYILDFCLGCLNIIELTDEEQIESEQYDDLKIFSQQSKINMGSSYQTVNGWFQMN